jgi:hypothetical protein
MDNKDYGKSEDLFMFLCIMDITTVVTVCTKQASAEQEEIYLNAFFISSFEGSSFSACLNASTAPL